MTQEVAGPNPVGRPKKRVFSMPKIPNDIKKIKHIPSPLKHWRSVGDSTTNETINQILQRVEGYTKAEVKQLMAEGRIIVTINKVTRKLKGTEELFVLEETPKATETIDRFADIELE